MIMTNLIIILSNVIMAIIIMIMTIIIMIMTIIIMITRVIAGAWTTCTRIAPYEPTVGNARYNHHRRHRHHLPLFWDICRPLVSWTFAAEVKVRTTYAE